MYDHRSKNMLRYNTVSPPDYPLANVTAPVFLYHGANDLLLSPKVKILLYSISLTDDLKFDLGHRTSHEEVTECQKISPCQQLQPR